MNKAYSAEFTVAGNTVGVIWNNDGWRFFFGGLAGPEIQREVDFMSGDALKDLEGQLTAYEQADNKINREDHGANLALDLEAA